jgi:hypothetical protein
VKITQRYVAFDPDGNKKGPVSLDWKKRTEMEAKGWTFERVSRTGGTPRKFGGQ